MMRASVAEKSATVPEYSSPPGKEYQRLATQRLHVGHTFKTLPYIVIREL
jgi:hypothetical protein